MLDFARKCLGLAIRDTREQSWENIYDPCPFQNNWTDSIHKNGLTSNWGKKVILNPPFSKSGKFITKAVEQALLGSHII